MKILKGYGLDIGVSVGGHLRLEQEDPFRSEPQVIFLNKHEARLLIAELRMLIRNGAGELLDAEDVS